MDPGSNNGQRYARHLVLPEIGLEGQEKLRHARVLCVGAGGLGSPVALYLAAAGVGRLGIADFDAVDLSNLQRQVLHGTPDVGRPKTESARDAIRRLNPDVEVVQHEGRLTSADALEVVTGYDLVVDGTDNFPARYLINDACVLLQKPNVYGSVFRFEGQASVFAPHLGGPCYRCLFPEPPPPDVAPSCAEAGVLGVVPGIIGSIQAAEALKFVLGLGTSLLGRLLVLDVLALRFRELNVRRDPRCAVCGEQPTIRQLIDLPATCRGRSPGSTTALRPDEVTVQDLRRVLDDPASGVVVLDVREPAEQGASRIPGSRPFPLSTLASRWKELDPSPSYYLYCQSGARSLQAVAFLRRQGFRSVHSVQGGIAAWRREPQAPGSGG